jgi:hypothetical protein
LACSDLHSFRLARSSGLAQQSGNQPRDSIHDGDLDFKQILEIVGLLVVCGQLSVVSSWFSVVLFG